MQNASSQSTKVTGRFWRILPATALDAALDPVISASGRFHHDGQRALYCSPTAQAAGRAVAPYLKPGAAPALAIPLVLERASVLDLRDLNVLQHLGLQGHEADRPWIPELRAGLPATSWRASDAARQAGADGMIYTARSAPHRWHLVLFRWNEGDGAILRQEGDPLPHRP